ncbi:MAG TPA: hypothetical protein VGG11_17645 [Xanthobacteraceae bacterium]
MGPVIDAAAASELSRAFIPQEKFALVLSAFGDLPNTAQCAFACKLIAPSETYRFRSAILKQGVLSRRESQEHLETIGKCAARLLKLLGITDPESVAKSVTLRDLGAINFHSVATTSILTGLYRVAVERRPGIEVDAWKQLSELLVLLSDVVEIAAQGQGKSETRETKGKSVEGELVYAIFDIYADFRSRFPSSGPEPKFDARLRAFVRACLDFVISPRPIPQADQRAIDVNLTKRTTDAVIKGHWDRWRSLHK